MQALLDRLGLAGRVVVALSMGGGLSVGGFLTVSSTLSGQVSSGVIPTVVVVLFGVGAGLGWVHGVLLGYAGRRPGRTRQAALVAIATGSLVAIPALAGTLLIALGIALTGVALQGGGVTSLLALTVAWVAAVMISVWVLAVTLAAVRNAWLRYPEGKFGTALLGGLFLVLLAVFERNHPVLWGTGIRVTGMGAAVLALGATVWIGAPVLLSILHLLYRPGRPSDVPVADAGTRKTIEGGVK